MKRIKRQNLNSENFEKTKEQSGDMYGSLGMPHLKICLAGTLIVYFFLGALNRHEEKKISN